MNFNYIHFIPQTSLILQPPSIYLTLCLYFIFNTWSTIRAAYTFLGVCLYTVLPGATHLKKTHSPSFNCYHLSIAAVGIPSGSSLKDTAHLGIAS